MTFARYHPFSASLQAHPFHIKLMLAHSRVECIFIQ